MLRGSIDYTAMDCVEGWIYSAEFDVRGRTVMAFVDGVCVGAGEIGLPRADLADAGLGHGEIGFHFGITPAREGDLERLTVRLEGSDFSLLQKSQNPTGALAASAAPSVKSAGSIDWMRAQGWLDQAEYDFLSAINEKGVFDASLRRPRKAEGPTTDAPSSIAAKYFSLAVQDATTAVASEFVALDDLATAIRANRATSAQPILALWANENLKLTVYEGSHIARPDAPVIARAYTVGHDRLLLIDSRVNVDFPGETAAIVTVLVPQL